MNPGVNLGQALGWCGRCTGRSLPRHQRRVKGKEHGDSPYKVFSASGPSYRVREPLLEAISALAGMATLKNIRET